MTEILTGIVIGGLAAIPIGWYARDMFDKYWED